MTVNEKPLAQSMLTELTFHQPLKSLRNILSAIRICSGCYCNGIDIIAPFFQIDAVLGIMLELLENQQCTAYYLRPPRWSDAYRCADR